MSIFLLSVVVTTTCAVSTPQLYDQDIKYAMNIIASKLEARHQSNTCWETTEGAAGWLSKHDGGTTAIATLALLSAGQSSNAPKLHQSLEYLWNIEHPSSYVLAIRTSIWAMLSEKYTKRLKLDTKRLVTTMGYASGGWGNYATPPHRLTDASPLVREFGMIALREAGRRGQRIPKECWSAIANATLGTQHKNGGWAYEQGANRGVVTANMTVAGLNCLLGVDEVYGDDLSDHDATRLHNAIDKAISWLNKHATTSKNYGGTALMSYLYALERAAMTCGLAEIRNKDWFVNGASAVIESHCGVRTAKGSTVNLSFALLFLSRGRIPIGICELVEDKLHVDPLRTSNIMSDRIASVIEQPLSWQLVTERDKVETWLAAPVLFIQNPKSIPEDLSKLTEYLDRGGMLLLLATGKEHQIFTALANTLCPTIESQKFRDKYWTHTLLEPVKGVLLTTWHDGIRDRIFLIQNTTKRLIDSDKSKVSKLFVNICCGGAELDRWKPRLGVSQPDATKQRIILAKHDGAWNADALGLYRWKVQEKPLSKISGKRVVLIGGIHSSEVTDELIKQILRTAESGSTILIESIGGRGSFAKTIRKKIGKKLSVIIQPDARFKNLVGQRGWTIRTHQKINTPLFVTVGKGKILLFDCDIRNALLEQPAWGVHGYTTETAISIIEQLLCQ